ncbi:hypothetical protein ACQJBY_033681 [Aegilops geniculata]
MRPARLRGRWAASVSLEEADGRCTGGGRWTAAALREEDGGIVGAKSAPKSAERAPDFLCLKFSCTMETPLETLACDVLTSCRSRSLRVAGRALYPSASSPAP